MRKCAILFISLLLMPTAACAQDLSRDQVRFLNENSVPIAQNTSEATHDWAAVIHQVKDKRLLLLGEFNHGSKEVFTVRNDLIKALHSELGFDLILFESGVGEVGVIDMKKAHLSGRELTHGFFGPWRTSEFEALVQFTKENNITIAGFDVQRTGNGFTQYLSAWLAEKGLNAIDFNDLEARFVTIKQKLSNNKTNFDSVQNDATMLAHDYQTLRSNLADVQMQKSEGFIDKTLADRIAYLEYMLDFVEKKDWNERWFKRDDAMAKNVEWILGQYPPDKKAIIIAHNFHIARFNEKQEVMGEILANNDNLDMYIVGFFAGAGSFANNAGKEEQMVPAVSDGLDIKHIISSLGTGVSFIDVPCDTQIGSEWLFDDIIVNDTFIDLWGTNKMSLAKSFDGVILLDKVSPPEK